MFALTIETILVSSTSVCVYDRDNYGQFSKCLQVLIISRDVSRPLRKFSFTLGTIIVCSSTFCVDSWDILRQVSLRVDDRDCSRQVNSCVLTTGTVLVGSTASC